MSYIEKNETGLFDKEIEFSEEIIQKYVEGCSEVAIGLHTVVENILGDGKKPIILIPSRGAVPIFLLALEALRSLDSTHVLVDPQKIGYYPRGIFDLLSSGRINKTVNNNEDITINPDKTDVDVLIYPFTADVSMEKNGEEWLANKLRLSCAKAVYDLVFKTNQYPDDLNWYYLLMSKIKRDGNCSSKVYPEEVVRSLQTYPGAENAQIVLVDTVISGRAAQDIVGSFAALGHKVVPILSVDTINGSHLQPSREAEIKKTMRWEYMGDQDPFIHYPLITEDKGAALLGVAAINFANFNKPGYFKEVNPKYEGDFLPQSCIWTLSPGSLCQKYLKIFLEFIELANRKRRGEPIPDLANFRKKLLPLIQTHGHAEGTVKGREMLKLLQVPDNIKGSAKESASHILSVNLPDDVAEKWIQGFINQKSKNGS